MLQDAFRDVYEKLKLNFYKNIFGGFAEREATLTATETFCVEVIHAMGNPTITEVGDFLNLSQPNMTYKANQLVKKGYLEKYTSPEDRREVYLRVTDRFYHYYRIRNEYMTLVLQRAMDKFPEEDIQKLTEMLETISSELMPEVTKELDKVKHLKKK
ncbi:MAG: MarR family transcriptional regulator [Tissierellia bacterium]|nr:MarR family transcriptional regulator [Tissierellia bacterium]